MLIIAGNMNAKSDQDIMITHNVLEDMAKER